MRYVVAAAAARRAEISSAAVFAAEPTVSALIDENLSPREQPATTGPDG
jgi:hypothetical protein